MRTSLDILMYAAPNNYWQQIQANFKTNQLYVDAAGPGHWNDPDSMLVGLGFDGESALTDTEIEAHFFLWAFAKAPLILPAMENIIEIARSIISNPYYKKIKRN